MATRDVGTTQRPPSTALLTIDSEDRFDTLVEKRSAYTDRNAVNRSPYNFTLTKQQPLINGYMTRLAVSEVVFPWLIPNINENTDILRYQYTIAAGPVQTGVVSLTSQSFLRPSQIAAEITTQIAGNIAGFTMAYGVDGKPRFTYDAGAGNTIAFIPLPPTGPVPLLTKPANVVQLFDLLGFTTGPSPPPPPAPLPPGFIFGNNVLAQTGAGLFTFCQATRYVDIVSPQLTANQGLPDATSQQNNSDALCRIYLGDATNSTVSDVADPDFCPAGCAPTIIYRQFATPKQIQWNAIQPVSGRIQFQVLDDTGAILGLSAGVFPFQEAEWSMSLLITEN